MRVAERSCAKPAAKGGFRSDNDKICHYYFPFFFDPATANKTTAAAPPKATVELLTPEITVDPASQLVICWVKLAVVDAGVLANVVAAACN
jgi:hypothetical protein